MNSIDLNAQVSDSETTLKEVKQVRVSDTINLSADKLWEIVGPGFADAHVWSSALDHSEGRGAGQFEGAVCNERYCEVNTAGFSEINEKLTLYNQETRELAYNAYSGLPSFVKFAENHWEALDLGNGKSQIRMSITMKMKPFMGWLMGGMFRRNLDKTIDSVIDDLKIYAETGEISEAKKKRLAELAKKAA